MTLLEQNIIEDPDFAETRLHALKDASDVACAEVVQTTNRPGGALSVDATMFYLGGRTRETTMTLKV